MTRGDARELAVHLIYSQTFTGDEPEQMIAARLEKNYYEMLAAENELYSERPKGAQRAYIDTVVAGVTSRMDALNELIQQYSVNCDVSRISRLARTIMQLAIFEIQSVADVPTGVAISEAVRLAKKYDGSDTGAFVNGILGTFARSLTPEEVK